MVDEFLAKALSAHLLCAKSSTANEQVSERATKRANEQESEPLNLRPSRQWADLLASRSFGKQLSEQRCPTTAKRVRERYITHITTSACDIPWRTNWGRSCRKKIWHNALFLSLFFFWSSFLLARTHVTGFFFSFFFLSLFILFFYFFVWCFFLIESMVVCSEFTRTVAPG